MLAALLIADERALSDAYLGEALWGKNPPKTYQAQLYTYVSRLRPHLRDNMRIIRKGPGYQLRTGSARFDYKEFDELSRAGRTALRDHRYDKAADLLGTALSLWRGPTLADVTEHMAEAERPRIEEARLEALELRIDAELALGRHDRLTAELTGLVNTHPLRERLRAQLMMALYRSDQQAAAIATYHEGCLLLAEELGVDPGPTLRSTYQAILTDDLGATTAAAPRPRPPAVAAARPSTLPPDIADFSGRREQLASVAEVVGHDDESRPPPVLVVTGMAGLGKTALALHAANRHRAAFPDGRLFVDLGGSTDRPRTPEEALGVLLEALGHNDVPASLDQRALLYRNALAERRVLVVLDDAADDEQVRALLPGAPRCQVLVTSRTPLPTLEGQRTVWLEPFTDEESLALLIRITGAKRVVTERTEAERIVWLCGGLPLAIRVAGARLAAKPHWSLSWFANRLSGDRRRLGELKLGDLDVRRSLAGNLRGLSAGDRAALLLLADFDAPSFGYAAIGRLLGVAQPVAEQVTERLVDRHLLAQEGTDLDGELLFGFHPLLRLLAREMRQAVGMRVSSRDLRARLTLRPA
ncbi:AfsR/SARP family transcriptional regulator [Saccharothrix xinjiangensis]|uniref:BTAD domain-containing putative transcriptional regulator n=1 Tax=Saccharothrix xinjiangensis TaxID=204798 RepID=A0ABV9YE48_9PSEU